MFGRRRKPQAATPASPRTTVPLDPNATATFASTLAGWMDETWVGRHVMFGSHQDVEVLALVQHPTHHRTVLHLGTSDGIETVDLHAKTLVTSGTMGDLL